jgi:hypothetical protein
MRRSFPMTEEQEQQGINPAGDIADLLEDGEHDIQLSPDQDKEDLREFIETVEETDGMSDPGTNAMVRIAKTMLDDEDRQ